MSISPDQFLAQPSDPDEEETPDWRTEGGPLASIAWSLSDISALLEGFVRGPANQEQATNPADYGYPDADLTEAPLFPKETQLAFEEIADLEAKYEALFGLLADVEKLVSKSTSKLANSVRDAIQAWKTGEAIEPDEHNHAWERNEIGNHECACGAWIDMADPEYPNGIVREPSSEPSDG